MMTSDGDQSRRSSAMFSKRVHDALTDIGFIPSKELLEKFVLFPELRTTMQVEVRKSLQSLNPESNGKRVHLDLFSFWNELPLADLLDRELLTNSEKDENLKAKVEGRRQMVALNVVGRLASKIE